MHLYNTPLTYFKEFTSIMISIKLQRYSILKNEKGVEQQRPYFNHILLHHFEVDYHNMNPKEVKSQEVVRIIVVMA